MSKITNADDFLKVVIAAYGDFLNTEESPLDPTMFIKDEEIMKEYKNSFSVSCNKNNSLNNMEITMNKPAVFFIRNQQIIVDNCIGVFKFEKYWKNRDYDTFQVLEDISNLFNEFVKSRTGNNFKIIEAMSKRANKIASVRKEMNLPFYKIKNNCDFAIIFADRAKELHLNTKPNHSKIEHISDDVSVKELIDYSNPTVEEIINFF